MKTNSAAYGIAADLGTESGARAVIARFPQLDILVNILSIFEPSRSRRSQMTPGAASSR
jgi:hypothetical protein